MKRNLASLMSYLFCISVMLVATQSIAQPTRMSEQEALILGTDAYVYGYPLITMDMTRRVMTNLTAPDKRGAPMGQFFNARSYPNAAFRDVTAPNADTLYSVAWLDLSKEPYILHVPDEGDRYYLMPMLSGWTNVFADPGTRTTGTKAEDYAIVGPHWKGELPENVTIIHAPTNLVWILGRTYCTGTPEDYKAVHAIQDQYKLIPLSAYGKTYTPPPGKIDPSIDMTASVREQVNQLDADIYFKKLAELLKDNPPAPADAPMVAKLARLGIVAGKDFDITKLDPDEAIGLSAAVKVGQEKIMGHYNHAGVIKNGWNITTHMGQYGTDYLQRALVAAIGLGANRPQDAIYPITKVDADNNQLNGANKYLMHFEKDKMPPVDGFWSLTMYDDQYFFVNNPLNRYTLSPRNAFQYNTDGSLDLYIQHDSPGKEKESNWLPAPTGNFILMLRLYWPKQAMLDGAWAPPAVQLAH